jgi:hypothetical protein
LRSGASFLAAFALVGAARSSEPMAVTFAGLVPLAALQQQQH